MYVDDDVLRTYIDAVKKARYELGVAASTQSKEPAKLEIVEVAQAAYKKACMELEIFVSSSTQ